MAYGWSDEIAMNQVFRRSFLTWPVGALGRVLKAVKDAAEEAHHPPYIERRGGETAQQNAQVVTIGRLHGSRRVAGGNHGLFDEAGKTGEVRGRGGV